jgi:hypothetical protein
MTVLSPQKLFDYLDGKLPTQEREELEEKMANDSNLLRQLAIARKLRESMPGSQEIVGSLEDATNRRGAILSRRVGLAFIVLVFVNVFIGLWFIFHSKTQSPRDSDVRRQVEQALKSAAVSAMPTPNIEADEIKLSASSGESEAVASKVIVAAQQAAGSGAKTLTDETGTIVLVDIPKNREMDFRRALVPLGAAIPPAVEEKPAQPNERKFLQVRVTKSAP